MDDVDLSVLIGRIYDAAPDSTQWPDVLVKVARFVGASAASLYWKDAASKTGELYYDCGIDPHFRQLYFEKYITLDPFMDAQVLARIDEPIASTDVMPANKLRETRIYREWAQPQRIVDSASVVLDKAATSAAMFGVFRHEREGLIDDEVRHRMRVIAPHLRRAMHVGRLIDRKTSEAAAFADLLDGLDTGTFLVDGRGAIVHANAAGQSLLAAGEVVRASGGRLMANNPRADQAFREVFRAASDGDGAVGVKGIAMPLDARDGERHVAHVMPLTSGARRRTGASSAAVAALFLRRANIEVRSPPETIARHYKLTPTELRVLLAVVDVGGGPEVAEALGIGQGTVKWHLARLYQKTGASRQADLVKLVAGFSNPLLN